MKKLLIVFGIISLIIFVISFVTAGDLNLFIRILLSAIAGALGTFYFWSNSGSKENTKRGITNLSIKNQNKIIYIYEPFAPTFKYRIEKGCIYEGWNNKFVYRIENGKLYKGMDASPIFSIEGNKVYRFKGNRTPIYRIENNKIYEGDFGIKPIYEIKVK